MKTHKSLNTLPIYNYDELLKKNDLRFLINNVDVFDLPEITKEDEKELSKAWNLILKSFEYKENKLQITYFNCQTYFLDYLGTRKIKYLQKYNSEFTKYLKLINEHFENFKYKENNYSDVFEMLNDYKKDFDLKNEYLDYLTQRLNVFSYNLIKAEQKNKFDLYNELSILQINGININEFECSVKKFEKIKENFIKKQRNGKV